MSWKEALKEIESHEFAAKLNVVSSTQSFFGAASKQPAVLELYRHMIRSGDVREEALGRIHDLSGLEVDRRYENPNDTSLAVLLWLTHFSAPDYVGIAADLVDRAPQCWYAKKLARRILVPPPINTGNTWVEEPPLTRESAGNWSGDVVVTVNPAFGNVLRYYHRKPHLTATMTGNPGPAHAAVSNTVGDLVVS